MADFCQQCSIAHFGKDFGELAKLAPGPFKEGEGVFTICEGCGPIYVDYEGRCMCDDCLENGHKKERTP